MIDVTALEAPGPEAVGHDVELGSLLSSVRREVWRRFTAGDLTSPECRGERVAALALAVIECLTADSPSADTAAPTAPTTWDRAVYDAMVRLDPERFTTVDGRMSAAARQMKARCGSRARAVLRDIIDEQLDDRAVTA